MTNEELQEVLKLWPKDANVEVMGFEYRKCGGWEAYHSGEIKIELDKNENILYIEGEI